MLQCNFIKIVVRLKTYFHPNKEPFACKQRLIFSFRGKFNRSMSLVELPHKGVDSNQINDILYISMAGTECGTIGTAIF